MRATSLFAAACALAFAIMNVVAVDEAQQSTVHLRIHAEDGAEIPNVSALQEGAQEVSSQKHHHERGIERAATRSCRKLKDEWFRDDIAAACGTTNRKGVNNFFYLLEDGQYLRNCNCDNFLGGLIWTNEDGWQATSGYVSAAGLDFRCYSTKKSTTWQDAIAVFNKDWLKCIPTDFTVTPL